MLCDLLNSLHTCAVLLRVARLIILPSAPASLSVLGGGGLRPHWQTGGRGGEMLIEQMRERER